MTSAEAEMVDALAKAADTLTVFITRSSPVCSACKATLGRDAWIVTVQGQQGRGVCLPCAKLDHFEFLPAGDTALTRRASKLSTRAIVVIRWSRSTRRFQRQGLLVEAEALERARAECVADTDVRARRRVQSAVRRTQLDVVYVQRFAACVRERYPRCPKAAETTIAEHACRKHSGRVGRSAAAKAFDETAVRLAVLAHIRHTCTPYDELLGAGMPREAARKKVKAQVKAVARAWALVDTTPAR